jgi:hypothetical protein
MLATTACPSVTTEVFSEGAEPADLCTVHPGPPLRPGETPPSLPRDTEQQEGEATVSDVGPPGRSP